jgi:hypothetical protein
MGCIIEILIKVPDSMSQAPAFDTFLQSFNDQYVAKFGENLK